MKKNLLLLFSFIYMFIFSQEYHFDYKCYNVETQIKGNYKGNKRTNIIYFNSENKDFIAYNYIFSQQLNRSFCLYDYRNNYMNSYSINKESNFSSLNYLATFPIKKYNDEIKINHINTEEVSKNLWLIKAFPSEKSKKPNLELTILIEKSEFPMSRIRFMDLTSNIHSKIYDALLANLDSVDYRIINVTIDYKNGVIMQNDFSKCEKINLKILTREKPEQK